MIFVYISLCFILQHERQTVWSLFHISVDTFFCCYKSPNNINTLYHYTTKNAEYIYTKKLRAVKENFIALFIIFFFLNINFAVLSIFLKAIFNCGYSQSKDVF